MKSISSLKLVAAAVLLAAPNAVRAVTVVGCYSSSTGLTFDSTDDFNSVGYCSGACANSAVFAMSNKKSCYCGDELPAASDKVDDTDCNLSCPGYPDDNCGSSSNFYVYNLETTKNIPVAGGSSSSATKSTATAKGSTPTPTTATSASVITVGGQTVVVTASSQPTSSGSEKSGGSSGPNKAGIAAGVVIGVVAIAGILGGIFLFMRNRKRRAIEEEHRRNAAVSNFIGGKPPTSSAGASSFNDTRLDPAVMAQRRMSDGSIADNQDYSRRILKVTNA